MPTNRRSPLGEAANGTFLRAFRGAFGGPLRDAFRLERPPPPTLAVKRLRRLILLTAAATVIVDLINLEYADEAGFGLGVRTVWALLRAMGFLFLMREVRFGRGAARPLGLILAATTVFASARLVQPRERAYLPEWPVLAGIALLTILCGLIVWRLFRSPEIAEHLSNRPARRQLSGWVVTARVASLTYGPLLLVPALVALGTLFDEPRLPTRSAVPLVLIWLTGALVLTLVTSLVSFVTLFGKRWARRLLAAIGLLVLVIQPALCWLLLGPDGLIRDGLPMLVAAGLGLYALWRSR
jgi:hypothetical protein